MGFLNAVLRAYDREGNATRKTLAELERTQPHVGLSHPAWLVAAWQVRGIDSLGLVSIGMPRQGGLLRVSCFSCM